MSLGSRGEGDVSLSHIYMLNGVNNATWPRPRAKVDRGSTGKLVIQWKCVEVATRVKTIK